MRGRIAFPWLVLAVLGSSCVYVTRVETALLDPGDAAGTSVESPFKAFLSDGRIAIFPDGAYITTDSVFGEGTLYSLDLASFDSIDALALDNLLGLESVRGTFDVGRSMLVSIPVAIGLAAFDFAVTKVFWGSCPTVYSFDQIGEILEAEAFSYSVVPLFEGRDVDRIGAEADEYGVVKLELRNEALETHYINHLALLEVRHAANQAAYPDEEGRILVVGDVNGATSATDRDGSDRLAELSARGGEAFHSSDKRIQAATTGDFRDYVELIFPRPASSSAALVLRLRNSLLNTILFYDLMLAAQGAEALDWLGAEMANIGTAVELGLWMQEIFGLEISVQGPDGWERVRFLANTGPLVWDEVAIQLPVPEGEELRVRLSFLADEWRIDFAGLASDVERAEPTVASFERVAPIGGVHDPELAARLALPDEDYLITVPSVALSLESVPLGSHSVDERTFFLSSQGYYTEWIRPEWIHSSNRSEEFRPSDEMVVRLMNRWVEEKDAFQERFFESRIPVR